MRTTVSVIVTVARGAVEKRYTTDVTVSPDAGEKLTVAVNEMWNRVLAAKRALGPLRIYRGDGKHVASCMPEDVLAIEAFTL